MSPRSLAAEQGRAAQVPTRQRGRPRTIEGVEVDLPDIVGILRGTRRPRRYAVPSPSLPRPVEHDDPHAGTGEAGGDGLGRPPVSLCQPERPRQPHRVPESRK